MNERLEDTRSRLLRAASLLGSFEPRALLRDVLTDEEYRDRILRVRLMSSLRELSSVEQTGDGEGKASRWVLRATARHRELSTIDVYERGASDITQALSGSDGYSPDDLDRMIETATDEKHLSEHLVALERAGENAPGHSRLYGLRSRLSLLRKSNRTREHFQKKKFVGRIREIDRISKWIDSPVPDRPLKTLHIEGHYGIGKSYLLERIVQITGFSGDNILVRLDFDQPSLQSSESGSIYEEISRQIGNALPHSAARLRALRLEHSERVTRAINSSSELIPRELIQEMADAVAGANRRVILLLDTLEVIEGQGATFVRRLMDDLDRLDRKGEIKIAVISAGRGPIFDAENPHLGGYIKLDRIEDELIRQSLNNADVPEEHHADILRRSQGSPLKLRLLIDQIKTDGRLGDEQDEDPLAKGIVNRAITSRLPPHLRAIATYGMVLIKMDADTLTNILAPALGLEDLTENATQILQDLGQQSWLMDVRGQDRIAHRADMRRELLEATYRNGPQDCARINTGAEAYYSDRDPILCTYHQLQLMRVSVAPRQIDQSVAERFPDYLLEELPREAQDMVRRVRGQRSSHVEQTKERGYSGADIEAEPAHIAEKLVQVDPDAATARARITDAADFVDSADERAVNDLRAMLEEDQRRESTHIIREGLRGAYTPESEAALLILCHNWQSGHWSMARQLFDLLPKDTLLIQTKENPQLEGRILLEIYAEFYFKELVQRLADDAFCETVAYVINASSRIGLHTAALDFALIAAGVSFEREHEGLGLIAPYLQDGPREWAYERLRQAAGIRAEFGLDFGEPPLPDSEHPTGDFVFALGPLNPYFDRMRALIEEHQASNRGRILDDLGKLVPGLNEAVDLFAPHLVGIEHALTRLSEQPTDVLSLIRAIGLISDWAEGYSFFHPIADLPTLARAASRWQQVVGGYWAYPSKPPPNWASTRAWSDRTAARTADLMTRGDHVLADRMLRFWADPSSEDPKQAARTLQRRIAPTFNRLPRTRDWVLSLRELSKSRVPEVFRPSLAMLADVNFPPDYLNSETPTD